MHVPLALCSPVVEVARLGREGPDLSRYLTVCGLLILTLIGLAYGVRRLFGSTLAARAAGRSLRIVDVLPLGGKRQLSVVRVYDRTFVLGLGEKDVSLVAELDRDDVPQSEAVRRGADEAQREAFVKLLERAKERVLPRPDSSRNETRVDTLIDDPLEPPLPAAVEGEAR